jgi:hypothetical protein
MNVINAATAAVFHNIKFFIMHKLVNDKWQWFLNMMKLDENTMPADQQREMKRAFFCSWGIFLRELGENSQFPTLQQIEDMEAEISQFLDIECAIHVALETVATDIETLDEKGFLFLDIHGRTCWCRRYYDQPWILQYADGKWNTKKLADQKDIIEAHKTRISKHLTELVLSTLNPI